MEVSDSDKPVTCQFCNQSEDNELLYGKFYQLGTDIITHYYCLLLSSNMEQNGRDNEGILGFLRADILKELKRGRRLACAYCRLTGATLACCVSKCKKVFHLPCGRKAGSLHQFYGEFKSYCATHRPIQKIDAAVREQIKTSEVTCPICYDTVDHTDYKSTLWAPCCRVKALFHRDCVQKLAMSAGYFFKCPLCNNKPNFLLAMQANGIFIPERDASWEMVPNAYQELLHRHHRCDAQRCRCPKGRNHEMTGSSWELMLCKYCGSQGVHIGCGNLKWSNPDWECNDCKAMLQHSGESGTNVINKDSKDDENEEMDTPESSEAADVCAEEQSPSLPSSARPRRRIVNRNTGTSKTENIEQPLPPIANSTSYSSSSSSPSSSSSSPSSSRSPSPESRPNAPTLVYVVSDDDDDDDVIEIPDDDDEDDVKPLKKESRTVVLTSDGIAIPVVKVPNSSNEGEILVVGDIQVEVPGKKNEEEVFIEPHSSRSKVINMPPMQQPSSTNNVRTNITTTPNRSYTATAGMSNMLPRTPVSNDPTPTALVRYMPFNNATSEGEQRKRIRLSDPSPVNFSGNGNMPQTNWRNPAMLSQTANVDPSAKRIPQQQHQQQFASPSQPTIICLSSHPNSRWSLPQAQPPQYMVAMGSFIPQQVYQMPYMRPSYIPTLQPPSPQQLIIQQQAPQIQRGGLVGLTRAAVNVVNQAILEDIVTID
ncbi:hypothetical protein C0J52_15884 [Blattella germanica]|nr:hypothetical protein C0J52_15884 [Blattella germanica]